MDFDKEPYRTPVLDVVKFADDIEAGFGGSDEEWTGWYDLDDLEVPVAG